MLLPTPGEMELSALQKNDFKLLLINCWPALIPANLKLPCTLNFQFFTLKKSDHEMDFNINWRYHVNRMWKQW